MKTKIAKLTAVGLLAAALVAVPATSRAADRTNAPAASGQTTKHKRTSGLIPFRGTVAGVDTNAMTLAIGKRTFDITSQTRIFKNGEPAILSDLVVGDKVGGAYKKGENGKLEARTIRVGEKKAAKKAKAGARN